MTSFKVAYVEKNKHELRSGECDKKNIEHLKKDIKKIIKKYKFREFYIGIGSWINVNDGIYKSLERRWNAKYKILGYTHHIPLYFDLIKNGNYKKVEIKLIEYFGNNKYNIKNKRKCLNGSNHKISIYGFVYIAGKEKKRSITYNMFLILFYAFILFICILFLIKIAQFLF
jgi:hypothetical protein